MKRKTLTGRYYTSEPPQQPSSERLDPQPLDTELDYAELELRLAKQLTADELHIRKVVID